MNKPMAVLTITILLLISTISALCEKGQIDINTASAEKLDDITQVGPATAEEIIKSRPFNSLDELIDVKYIGDIKLALIKTEGLACVNGQEEEVEEEEDETEEPIKEVEEPKEEEENEEYQEITEIQDGKELSSRETGPIELQEINLNPKIIKSEDDNENLSKNNYAIYGLIFFCILLVVLFILRKNKYTKNEFK